MGAGAPKPRFAIEHAVNLLFELLHENTYEEQSDIEMRKRRKTIVGGKYWVQHRADREDVGFHYDKDDTYILTMYVLISVTSTTTLCVQV